ncbi:MAG: 3-dehydroquinate synthase [Methylacidiphilales bacterium]|nr:3-dehydroquinate synthase [Candidatus Methylacidiphilales bacterium]
MEFTTRTLEAAFTVRFDHRIFFTRSVFSPENPVLARLFEKTGDGDKALVVVDDGVAHAFPNLVDQIVTCFAPESFPIRLVCPPLVVPGGEKAKNSPHFVEELHRQIDRTGLCRHSYLLAIGGGALLDAVGFAAATAHRGIRHIRFPTTTLGQADSGIGVKNGINAFGKKNFIGAFAPPFAVFNDSDFWPSLPPPERRAGLIEAIKVALIRDAVFFEELEKNVLALARGDVPVMEQAIYRCAQLHFQHITQGGDPFELGSARPLDFGHWAAHKLEQISGFSISHGEAVALGLTLDAFYSCRSGMLPGRSLDRVLSLLEKLDFSLYHPLMRETDAQGEWPLLHGLNEFREHLGGELTITLLEDIGRGIEVHRIDSALMQKCVLELAARSGFSTARL